MDITYEIESKLRSNVYCSNLDFIECVWGHVNDGNAHINIITPGQHIKDSKLATTIDEKYMTVSYVDLDQYLQNMVLVRVRMRLWNNTRNVLR